ncbi:MAG TPA: aldose 1-epimerase [Blastocatellia bacterium]|jgi:galactose mutarotase-like enzyme|nr:aldose 1-epimerase [Blastocatellia bacterium]
MSYQTYQHNRNYGCRITEFIYEGYRAVALENERLRVTVLADKGTDIYEFLYKPRDIDFMWRTWTGLRARAHFAPSSPRAAGAHMDYYEGGWQELFPNCGNQSLHQGAEVGQHGEVLLLPWRYSITKDDPDEIEVRFDVRTVRTPFHLVKTMALRRNEATLRIGERVTNEGGQEVDFTWGHHPAFGWPFIDENCRIDLPDCRIRAFADITPPTSRLKPDQNSRWPMAEGRDGNAVDLSRVPGPDVGAHDMVFLQEISDGWYAITNTASRVGFALRYPADLFKQLWYWQVYRGGRDYPWWSSTYNMALEPCATLPVLARQAERGEALRLGAGESLGLEMMAMAFEGLERVSGVSPEGIVRGS